MLAYETAWYGSTMVGADRWYPSSKTCSGCGTVKAKLSLTERIYRCESCGAVLDRDLNAAVNLARHGEAIQTETWPAGSGPAAGRGATGKTRAPSDARVRDVRRQPRTAERQPARWGPPLRKERLPEP